MEFKDRVDLLGLALIAVIGPTVEQEVRRQLAQLKAQPQESQEDTQESQEDTQESQEDTQESQEDTQESQEDTQESQEDTQEPQEDTPTKEEIRALLVEVGRIRGKEGIGEILTKYDAASLSGLDRRDYPGVKARCIDILARGAA